MTNFFYLSFLFIIILNNCQAGVIVVGTRFFINETTQSLNIKVKNDNDSDYIVKTIVDSDDFIISPPLFILHKNRDNIINIILNKKSTTNKDKIYSLTLLTIPKSELNVENNVVSLAVRSHFKLIYQHAIPTDKDLYQVHLVRSPKGGWYLSNNTNFVFLISLSGENFRTVRDVVLMEPDEKIPVDKFCGINNCSLRLAFVNDENTILKENILTYP